MSTLFLVIIILLFAAFFWSLGTINRCPKRIVGIVIMWIVGIVIMWIVLTWAFGKI